MNVHRSRNGFTLLETITSVLSIGIILALLLPSLGAVNDDFRVAVSLNNLRVLGTMHVAYANDWDGRQWTVTPDDFTEIIGGHYERHYSFYRLVPPVVLGFDRDGILHETSSGEWIQQSWWTGNCAWGNFRMWIGRPFHNYANGRAFDPLFWAPRQLDIPNERHEILRGYIELDEEWPATANDANFNTITPSYALSIAAQVDPEVYRGDSDGGAQRARDLPLGHKTPNLANARYPDLKTHMLEHYVLNPILEEPFIPDTTVPWFFNMVDSARPATLFYDGSVRLLPNMEVLVSNDVVVRQGEDSLWACDKECFGCAGYFEYYALPPSNLSVQRLVDQVPSHHVFTKDGILGRDTIFNE